MKTKLYGEEDYYQRYKKDPPGGQFIQEFCDDHWAPVIVAAETVNLQ